MMAEGESSRADINIVELVSSMRRELNYYWSLGATHAKGTKLCVIYKVPQHINNVDETAYKPIILSIGPYHHGNPSLLVMEKEKWNCLDYILKLNCENNLKDYLNAIGRLADQVRSCYSEDIKMENKKFLQMLLLDGCFILVSLYGTEGIVEPSAEVYGESSSCEEKVEEKRIEEKGLGVGHENEGVSKKNKNSKCGHMMKKNSALEEELSQVDLSQQISDSSDHLGEWYLNFVVHDLFLLENQIPFYVVKIIYELLAGKEMMTALTNKIANFVERSMHYYPKAIQESDRPKDFYHLLHLCHMYIRPSQRMEEDHRYHAKSQYLHRFLSLARKYFKLSRQREEDEQNSLFNQQLDCIQEAGQKRWRRAVQYYESGVEFKRKEFDKGNPHSLLDITFCNGVLEIPCLPIDENTGSLFRNLIAFEQTCPEFGNDFTAYVVFMSQLISRPEDVMLLVQQGIIVHILRSDKEVSTLFTKLSKDVVFEFDGKYYLKFVYWLMETHFQSRMKRWVAWLRNNKLSNPWLALGVLAAAVMLFCTVLQTLIAVLSCM